MTEEKKRTSQVEIGRELAEAMEKGADPEEFLKEKGALGKRSKTATSEQFQALSDYTGRKMRELADRIMAGEAAPLPYRRGSRSACTYCPYAGVCGFDPALPQYRYRPVRELSAGEFWNCIGTAAGTAPVDNTPAAGQSI